MVPVGSSAPYSVSKVAIVHMTLILGKVLGPDVLVNAVAPRLVDTAWTAEWSAVKENVAAAAPLRRVGQAGDIAVACEYLLNTNYTTGECIAVDGGMDLVSADVLDQFPGRRQCELTASSLQAWMNGTA